jgi:hypothetical protein
MFVGSATAATLVGATLLQQALFTRHGERALEYIPEGYKLVAFVDFTPTPTQISTFRQIDAAMGPDGMKGAIDSFLAQSPVPEKVRSTLANNIDRGLAFAGDFGKSERFLVLIPLKNRTEVELEMNRVALPKFVQGAKVHALRQSKVTGQEKGMLGATEAFAGWAGRYLVIASSIEQLVQVKNIEFGTQKSILKDSSFIRAMQERPNDSNLTVMYSDEGAATADTKKWMSLFGGFADTGLYLSFGGKLDTKSEDVQKALRSPMFTSADAAKLPSGTLFTLALTDLREIAGAPPEDEMAQGIMGGKKVIAFYPGDLATGKGADLLMFMDDTNGAKHDAVAQMLSDQIVPPNPEEKDQKPAWTESTYRGFKVKELAADVRDGFKDMVRSDAKGEPMDVETLLKDKTVAMAKFGENWIMATNRNLLNRAIDTYTARSGGLTQIADAQIGITINFQGLATSMRSIMKIDKMDKKEREEIESFLNNFSADPNDLGMFELKIKGQPDGFVSLLGRVPINYGKVFKPAPAKAKEPKKN